MRKLLTAALLLVATASSLAAQSYSKTGTFLIPASGSEGNASLYPLSLTISGAPSSIGSLSVGILGFTHSYLADLDFALVGPTNRAIILGTEFGLSNQAQNANLTFSDAASEGIRSVQGNLTGNVAFRPLGGGPLEFSGLLPAGLTFVDSFSEFGGTDANGTWSLYVFDDTSRDVGQFTMFELNFIEAPVSTVPEPGTYALVSAGLAAITATARRIRRRA